MKLFNYKVIVDYIEDTTLIYTMLISKVVYKLENFKFWEPKSFFWDSNKQLQIKKLIKYKIIERIKIYIFATKFVFIPLHMKKLEWTTLWFFKLFSSPRFMNFFSSGSMNYVVLTAIESRPHRTLPPTWHLTWEDMVVCGTMVACNKHYALAHGVPPPHCQLFLYHRCGLLRMSRLYND
jgi:hypothetical protein